MLFMFLLSYLSGTSNDDSHLFDLFLTHQLGLEVLNS